MSDLKAGDDLNNKNKEIINFTFEESNENLVVHLNRRFDDALLPSILEDPRIDQIPFSGKSVLLEGKAPNWMVAHFAVRAVINGAKDVQIRQVGQREGTSDTMVWPHEPLSETDRKSDAEAKCFTISPEKPGTVRLEFNNAPDEKGGKWSMADFINTPLYLPDSSSEQVFAIEESLMIKTNILIVGGSATNWMYAAVTILANMAGIKYILYDSPREKFYISIGALNPGKLIQRPKRVQNGLVIGIVGDPHSGKSVFKGFLEKIFRDEWPNSWWIEGDPYSPTPNWYIDGLSSQSPEEVEKIREEVKKTEWTDEMVLMVANNLRNARENLDVTLVDLPGGHHKVSPVQRIPTGREIMLKEVDLFILLYKNEAARKGWLCALREHNLQDHVFAEIESREPEEPTSLETRRDGHKILGIARGLHRKNPSLLVKPIIKPGAAEIIRHIHAWKAAQYAKAAIAKAFLTGQGGVRYGAAVLCTDGKFYSAGQYSSFNHCTNVHAEQGALVQAVMNGSFAVRVLALVSTDSSTVPRPCGICRQVMLEHVRRTGTSFDVAMVDNEGRIEIEQVAALLPYHWESHRGRRNMDESLRNFKPGLFSRPDGEKLRTGDCIQWSGKGTTAIGIVWDSTFLSGILLVKLKYLKKTSGEVPADLRCEPSSLAEDSGGWQKLPHSLTETFYYMDELQKAGFSIPTSFGPFACLVKPSEIEGTWSPKVEEDPELPKTFAQILKEAGLDISRFCYTGSRAFGLAKKDSDFDVFIEIDPEEIIRFRKTAHLYLETGKALIPRESGTWPLFNKAFPGGIKRITEEERFFESLEFEGKKVSLIFTSKEESFVYDENEWEPMGWHTVSGVVSEASFASFKRARFTVITDFRKHIEVISYHKFANLVKTKDRLSLGGWLLINKKDENIQRLVQILPGFDPIVWFP